MLIELIPADQRFAELLFQWRKEANTVQFNPLAPSTLEQIRDRLTLACSDLSDLKASSEFTFFAKVDGRVAASLTLKSISHMMMYGELGYTVGAEFQGKGVGTAAVGAFIAKIFAETPMRRLFAYVAEGNVASRRLLERLGFRNEGTLREHYVINGVPTNEVFYGLLRSEWRF
ncbi:MAG: GNAT family N-acetyltransferase [Bdellovibrionota bacterium]